MHRPIQGIDGELVDLFMELLDRETQADPHWWYDLGALSGVHIGLYARGTRTCVRPKRPSSRTCSTSSADPEPRPSADQRQIG
jgi:hypothetical protein